VEQFSQAQPIQVWNTWVQTSKTMTQLSWGNMSALCFFALIVSAIIARQQGTQILPALSGQALLILLATWVIGFAAILSLFKAFKKINGGVALIVANTAVFFMYFANISIFGGAEKLPLPQIILAIIYFIIIAQFLRTWSADKKWQHTVNRHILYALGTAVGWTVYFVANTWFVKTDTLTPIQSVLATEWSVAIVAWLYYIIKHRANFTDIKKSYSTKHIIPLIVIWLGIVWGTFLFYYGYIDTPANIINFIRLLGIVAATIFGWIFLQDKLTKKQSVLMLAALAILIGFIFVGQ
jgi:drug/metabolite transporter (DMT)-like permease